VTKTVEIAAFPIKRRTVPPHPGKVKKMIWLIFIGTAVGIAPFCSGLFECQTIGSTPVRCPADAFFTACSTTLLPYSALDTDPGIGSI